MYKVLLFLIPFLFVFYMAQREDKKDEQNQNNDN